MSSLLTPLIQLILCKEPSFLLDQNHDVAVDDIDRENLAIATKHKATDLATETSSLITANAQAEKLPTTHHNNDQILHHKLDVSNKVHKGHFQSCKAAQRVTVPPLPSSPTSIGDFCNTTDTLQIRDAHRAALAQSHISHFKSLSIEAIDSSQPERSLSQSAPDGNPLYHPDIPSDESKNTAPPNAQGSPTSSQLERRATKQVLLTPGSTIEPIKHHIFSLLDTCHFTN